MQERVRKSHFFQSGESFSVGDISHFLSHRTQYVSNSRASQVLRDMLSNGELMKSGERFARARPLAKVMHQRWRKHTDEQLGIVA